MKNGNNNNKNRSNNNNDIAINNLYEIHYNCTMINKNMLSIRSIYVIHKLNSCALETLNRLTRHKRHKLV